MHRSFSALLAFLGLSVQAQLPPYVAAGFPAGGSGYSFFTTTDFGGNIAQSNAVILDGEGHVAYRRTAPSVTNFRVWPDGRMSYAAAGRNILLDSTFAVIDTVVCVNGIDTDLHDIRLLPNGHYLLLGTEERTMDLSAYHYFQPNNAPGSPTATVKCGVVQELDANKALVWEWHLADHFDFLETDTTLLGNPGQVDWSHCNAVEQDTDGNVLLSCRHFNEVVKIDRNADTVIWRLGGVSNDFTFTNDGGFVGQHDIRRIANGHITLFDNGLSGVHPCRGVEYALDEVNRTAEAVWSRSFDNLSYSRAMGSVQRLSDGSTLIGWGALSPANSLFDVYAPDSTLVREVRFTDTLVTYRAFHFDALPFQLHRPEITCMGQDTTYLLTADAGWSSYVWSTGATGPTTTVAAYDTVYVEVSPGPGSGWVRSEPFVPADHCGAAGIAAEALDPARLWPNPARDHVDIILGETTRTDLDLLDAYGRLLWSTVLQGDRITVPLSAYPPGMYLVRMQGRVLRLVKE
ncbi:MAG: aryl-sulfate sulfotransferase [Flavobacteriales bacterium]|nr:aryl-sulfate sulfotransferase [Flavobacteriales bacterium]